MAKYRINQTLITALTNAGFIDGSGNIVQIFASRVSTGPTKFYKLTFNASTDIIETTNGRMMKSIEQMIPPAVKADGQWLIADPSTTKLYESVDEGDPNPTIDPASSGVEQIGRKEKNLVINYARASGVTTPAGRDKSVLGPWVVKARNYFDNLRK